MSRSRKKPYMNDYSNNYTRWAKRQASKKVRYYKNHISDGREYKKLYCHWNIRDYCCYWPEETKAYRK